MKRMVSSDVQLLSGPYCDNCSIPATFHVRIHTEAESKEKHCVCDLVPELTITFPYVHSRVNSNTFTMGNPMLESSLTWPQLTFLDDDILICIAFYQSNLSTPRTYYVAFLYFGKTANFFSLCQT
jgi:hypothetical protein